MVRNMITALDLRAVVARTRSREAGAGGWEAQRGKSRVAAAPTLTSPAGVPPSEPRRRRKAADDGEAHRQDAEREAKRQALPLTAASLLPDSAQHRGWRRRKSPRNGAAGAASASAAVKNETVVTAGDCWQLLRLRGCACCGARVGHAQKRR